ncbi:MAG: hypothetical protein MUE56_07145 [Ignavibacteria bacterium]|jgi:hypothetical protein|nr:hypothetical protein [Ignavibacteria bacterium]
METTYFSLATKEKFNKSLNHFFKVNDIVDEIEDEKNLADYIDEELDNKEITKDQILPIVGAIIRDKYNYSFDSFNIPSTITDFKKIVEETTKWTALDILIVYYNPNVEIFLINPRNEAHWAKAGEMTRDQMAVIYAKHLKPTPSKKLEKEAIKALEEMIAGKDVFANQEFIDHTRTAKRAFQHQQQRQSHYQTQQEEEKPAEEAASVPAVSAPVKAAPILQLTGKQTSTPKYSVLVTNELFHNGNVESWKKIIESYETTFPTLRISVFYEGELIHDINSLFKWGKVRSQSMIHFQVTGDEIKGVSKLQKYLFEGASPRFEQFLKLGVGKVLNLF